MSQIASNNLYTQGTPLYTYPQAKNQSIVTPEGQTVNITQNGNSGQQIYQYPSASLYDTSKPSAASGVNIYIYNPSGIGGPTSNSNATGTYTMPAAEQPASAPIANTPITKPEETEQKPQKTKHIVELTDNYIKTLESYLRSPDAELRKTGIKEIIKRYEEDTSRYNDPALTALLNIALQDTDANNRILAMAPIASGSAVGDENTIALLQKLQTSDKLFGQEAKMANDSLLNAVQVKKEVPDYSKDKK